MPIVYPLGVHKDKVDDILWHVFSVVVYTQWEIGLKERGNFSIKKAGRLREISLIHSFTECGQFSR